MNSTYLTIGKFLEITLSVHLSNFFNPPAKKKSYFIQNLFMKKYLSAQVIEPPELD